MQFKCIIVDDEPLAIKVLKNYIASVPQLKIFSSCKNAFEAIKVLNNEKIDLMFLDIHMPKFIGTEFLKTLRHPPKVIFTTAHKDFAFEAFELEAVDYLLKPISFERFLKAINKYLPINILENVTKSKKQGFLYFRTDSNMVKVFLASIIYIESLKDHIVIHRENDSDLNIKLPLGSVENMLPHNSFLRIHNSFIVSINKLTAYTKKDIEIGEIVLPIDRNYSDLVKKLSSSLPEFLEDVE